MTAFKFIHTADLHLDSRFKGLTDIPGHVKEELLQSSFFAFSSLVQTAIEEEVSFIVISGDLFDAEERSLQAQLFLKEQFDRLLEHQISVYIIHGNHDPLSNKHFTFQFGENVHIFPSDRVQAIPAFANNTLVGYVYGISYGSKAVYENLTNQYFKHEDPSLYHIALYHGTVGASTEHEPYAPCSLHDLTKLDYDYVALGHIHKKQILSEQPYVVYAGNIQGRHRNEDGERGCYLVEVDQHKRTHLSFIPLAKIEWYTVKVDCSKFEHEQQLIAFIQQTLVEVCHKPKTSYMISLYLYGVTLLHAQLALVHRQADLLETVQTMFPQTKHWLYIARLKLDTRMSYDVDKLIEDDTYLQQLATNMMKLQDADIDELMQQGYMQELWLHGELSRLLPKLEDELMSGLLDEVRTEIFDYVAQVKERDA